MARNLGRVVAVAAMFICGGTDARAAHWVPIMACDSVLIQGAYYPRVTFTVQNQHPYLYFDLIVAVPFASPSPEDTCRAVSSVAPGGWSTTVGSEGGVSWGLASGSGPFLGPGQSLGGFQLVLTREHSCCYELHFVDIFGDPVGQESVCFQCDVPVPVIKRSWGALKTLYR